MVTNIAWYLKVQSQNIFMEKERRIEDNDRERDTHTREERHRDRQTDITDREIESGKERQL